MNQGSLLMKVHLSYFFSVFVINRWIEFIFNSSKLLVLLQKAFYAYPYQPCVPRVNLLWLASAISWQCVHWYYVIICLM